MTQNRTGPIARALALSLAASTWAGGTSARSESLVDAWAIALQANAQLQSQNLNTAASDRNLAAARQAWIPKVRSFNVDAQLNTTPKIVVQGVNGPISSTGAGATSGSGGASATTFPSQVPIVGFHQTNIPISFTSASMPIYTGGRIKNDIRSADAQRNAQRSEEFRTALDLKVTVAEAYIAILRARRNLEVAETNVAQLESFARDIRNRKAQGLATRNDELSAEVSLANARLNLIRQRNALEVAWATYNRYLCRPPETVVPLDDLGSDTGHAPDVGSDPGRFKGPATGAGPGPVPIPPGEAEVRQLTAMALGGRPELAGLTEQARSLGAQAESTRAGVRPQASVVGGFLFVGQQNWVPQGYGLAAFMVDWTIVDAPTRRKAEALKLQETSALKRRDDAAQDIMLQVRTRWLDLQTARQSVGVARTAVAQAEENVNVVRDRYRQQLSNNTDVLDAVNRRVQSLSNFYNAVYDEALARVLLHRAVGDL